MKQISLKVKVLAGVSLAVIMMGALLLALPAQGGANTDNGYGYDEIPNVRIGYDVITVD